jgi:hypothetical protein
MSLSIVIDDSTVDQIVSRVAEEVALRLSSGLARPGTPWLSGAQAAADYLGWPVERVYKHLHELPHYRHGNRLMFRSHELDGYMEQLRER